MADIVVPLVLANLTKLGSHEANLLLGVEDKVGLLKSDLRFIKVFLQNSAGKRNDLVVKELVDQIGDAAFESEDVIDAYAARVIRERRRNLLRNLFHCTAHVMDLHDVANQTSSIRNIIIENVYRNKAIYGIIGDSDEPDVDSEELQQSDEPNVDGEELQQSLERWRRRIFEEEVVVCLVNHTTTLISQLTDPCNQRLEVISILGMGGFGKTTLARKIHKDTRVKYHFDFCAWVNVSQQWQAERLLLDVLKSFKQVSEETSEKRVVNLKDELQEKLKGKRYLIVMDDTWSTQVWEELSVAFPDESNGSRILITTRERKVAWHASPTPPHKLRALDENESWELLQKKVFRGGQCLPNLEERGRELAKSCKGLPLSIVLLGGILAAKVKSTQVWSRFVGNVNSYLSEEASILTLSYNHLPPELKSCFLYVGLFPEDSEINVRDLIEFWISEGFIRSARNASMYDVAEDYLHTLIDRSMIQVATKRFDGGVKTCRIHDLLRDLCIAESRRDKFFEIYSIHKNISINRKSRRLSIQYTSESHFELPCARSLFFFGDGNYPYKPIPESVWKQTKLIRVLYLSRLKIKKIPSQIKELIFLRCIFIKECEVDYVSSSIWNFPFLGTLHLDFSINRSFLKGIWSVMKDLRNLYVSNNLELDIPPRSLLGEPFSDLQVLSWLEVNQNAAFIIAKFPKLRKLGLRFLKQIEECEAEVVMATIARLESLQSFKIECLLRNSNKVGTRLNLLPSALTKISWKSRHFDWDIFRVLARQPHLRFLKITISKAYRHLQRPHVLSIEAGNFPQLQVLKLSNLRIKTWKMAKDAMPNLESLFIDECDELEYLPEDELLCRSTLQLVEVSGEGHGKLKTTLRDFKIGNPATPCNIKITGFV